MKKLLINVKKMTTPPRFLTKHEIEDILNATLPFENNAMFVQKDYAAKRVMIEQIRDYISMQLAYVKLVPNGISELIKMIIYKLELSQCTPGYMIGVSAAESYGAEISQAALNSKRLTGGKDLNEGLMATKAVLSGTQGAIAPAYLYFKNPYYTVYDIFRVISQFTYITLFGEGINSLVKNNRSELLSKDEHEEDYWVPLYKQIKGKIPFDYQHVIRIYLNTNYMYQQQITVSSVVTAIENSSSRNLLYCIPSPLFLAEPYIDIYVDSKGIEDMVEKETNNAVVGSVETFYTNVFLNRDCHVKGIPHVLKITPEFVAVKDSFYPSEKLEVSEESRKIAAQKGISLDNIFYCKLNTHFMSKHGIPVEKLEKLVELCGMEIVPKNDDEEDVLLIKSDGRKPESVLMETINKANEKQDQVFRDSVRSNNGTLPPLSEVFKMSRQYYASVRMLKDKNVSMLIPFSRYKIIDIERCVSGDMFENLKVIGIVGLKNYLNDKIGNLISSAGGTPMWMLIDLVMTSYMCRLGHMTKFNLKGVEETSGPASAMLWKDTFRNMQASAAAGKRSNETKFSMVANYYENNIAPTVQLGSVADVKFLAGEFRGGSRVSDVLFDKQRESQYLIEKERMRQMAKEGKSFSEISKGLSGESGVGLSSGSVGVKIVPNPNFSYGSTHPTASHTIKTASTNSEQKASAGKKRATKPSTSKPANKPQSKKPAVIDLDDL